MTKVFLFHDTIMWWPFCDQAKVKPPPIHFMTPSCCWLAQERCNSNELAMDLHFSCTNPSMWWPFCDHTKVKASPGPLSSCIIMAGRVSVPSSNRQFQRIPLTLSSEIVNSLRPNEALCISKLTIIGSDNGLSPDRCQVIIWTNAGILLIGPLRTNFSEIFI